MIAETKDRRRLGETVFSVTVVLDDGDDSFSRYHEESGKDFPTLDAAKAWASELLPTLTGDGSWWARITPGEFVADEFDDDEFGTVLDADLVEDHDSEVFGYIVDGSVEWEDS